MDESSLPHDNCAKNPKKSSVWKAKKRYRRDIEKIM